MKRNPTEELANAPLSRGQKNIVDALAAIYPRRMHIFDLVNHVYALDPNGGPDNAMGSVRTQICNIRKRLPMFGWTIPKTFDVQGQHGWYRLEPVANDNTSASEQQASVGRAA